MKRSKYEPVTALPILIPLTQSEAHKAEGWATFLSDERLAWVRRKTGQDRVPVRSLRDRDLSTKTMEQLRSKGGAHRVTGLITLARAIEAQDSLAQEKAAERDPTLKVLIRRVRTAARQDLELPQRRLSQLLSEFLESVQLVLWWTGKQFLPALYCAGGLEGALLVHTLFSIVGWRKGLGVCPYCGSMFRKQRADQDYCSVAHREAHRVARWRGAKKRTASKSRKERRKRR